MLNFFKKPKVNSPTDVRNEAFVIGLYQETGLNYPTAKHDLAWSTRKKHLDFLHNMVIALKPTVVFETGTFEAHGTYAMAAAAHANNNGAQIFTIDYDGDPIQDKEGTVSHEEWLELKAIRAANLDRIKTEFPNCQVKFVEGDSREVLPELLKSIDQWNFWYQDSMHFAEGIQQEWEIMEAKAAPNPTIIFDDGSRKNGFSRWFTRKYKKSWIYTPRRDFDHKQCLAQKR
ncbi:MAG: class I SAM-dependent methyltransferase [Porticoccaceae bacterium]